MKTLVLLRTVLGQHAVDRHFVTRRGRQEVDQLLDIAWYMVIL